VKGENGHKGRHWSRAEICAELAEYQGLRLKANELELDIEALEAEPHEEQIEADALRGASGAMLSGGVPGDKTGRTAVQTSAERELSSMRRELSVVLIRIKRVEGWIAAMPNRAAEIARMKYGRGMSWGEIVAAHNLAPPGGVVRDARALHRWLAAGIEQVERLQKKTVVAVIW
jgi:hypothetical protein